MPRIAVRVVVRVAVRAGVALAALFLLAPTAQAAGPQDFPAKTLRIVVPYPPGGNPDTFARLAANALQAELGQPVVVENKPGGGSIIATDAVAKATPDGYTLLLASAALTTNPSLYPKLPYDTRRDFRAVAMVGSSPVLLVTHARSGVARLADLQARDFSFGSPGNGTVGHLAGAAFTGLSHTKGTHVAYKGTGPAQTDLVGGHIQVLYDNLNSAMPFVADGRMRPLALAAPARSAHLPDVPTFKELGFPIEARSWFGIVAPAGTPQKVVDLLNRAIVKGTAAARTTSPVFSAGAEPGQMTPGQFQDFLAAETSRWQSVIRQAGIQPD